MTESGPEGTWAIIGGGGTAGHLLPGLSVARALVEGGRPASSIHFVGAERGPEATLVPEAGFTVEVLPGRGIQRSLSPKSMPANLAAAADLVRAMVSGIAIVRRRRPSVVVVLGGYASLACGIGAVLCRRPLVLMEQNKKAGAANRLLRWFAAASVVSFEDTDLPRATVVGNPLRTEMRAMAEAPDPVAARRELGLPEDRTTIVVFSGSLGSRRINEAVADVARRWADRDDISIRHVTGRRDFEHHRDRARNPSGSASGLCYQVVDYEDRAHLLLDAGDLGVTRSGGTVFELMAAGLPSILVPLPIATRDHQMANARAVAATGGAVVVADAELDADRLEAELTTLLQDRSRRTEMAQAMKAAAVVDAAERAAVVIEGVAGA